MTRPVMVAGVVVVCLPMVFALWLLAAVSWPKMDAVTRLLPQDARGMVARAIVSREGYGARNMAGRKRAEALDIYSAQKAEAAHRAVTSLTVDRNSGVYDRSTLPKLQELYARQVANRKAAREMSQRAATIERLGGDSCEAEELYAQAGNRDSSGEIYEYTEGVGRAGLRCGDLAGARAGLETAVMKETRFIQGTDEDALTNVRDDLRKDREYLVVVYERAHEGALARKACTEAHPGWAGCSCKLSSKPDVICTEVKR